MKSSSLHTGSLADRPLWFSSVDLSSKRGQGKAKNVGAGRRSCLCPHWVESESLESRLACVGVGVQLWWAAGGQWRVCVLRRRFSSDCKKERRALSSSRGEEPSSSTSWISAKVTGCVLKRASRGRRERLLPFAGPFGTGNCWGNSSIADAIRWAGRTWKPEASITIWRTAAMVEQESSETEGSISESLNTSLRTVCLCAVSSLNEETLSQEQQSSSQSKVQPNKHSRKLQVQVHCSILEDTVALKLLWSASALQHSVCFNSAVACWFHSSSFCVCVRLWVCWG